MVKIIQCFNFMKRIYFIALVATILYALSFTIGDTIEYEKEPPRNNWSFIETNPVPSMEPMKDPLPLPDIKATSTDAETSPDVPENAPSTILLAQTTAYNTLEAQTDSTPCISASGDNICGRTDVVACPNHLPFGTMIEIGEMTYVCLDRTHPRFGNRFDISFDKDYQGAIEYGLRTVEVKVLNM